MPRTYTKRPGASKTYQIDWRKFNPAGVVVSTGAWVTDSGITEVSTNKSDTRTEVKLSGGTAGETYKSEVTMTASDGEIEVDCVFIVVEDC